MSSVKLASKVKIFCDCDTQSIKPKSKGFKGSVVIDSCSHKSCTIMPKNKVKYNICEDSMYGINCSYNGNYNDDIIANDSTIITKVNDDIDGKYDDGDYDNNTNTLQVISTNIFNRSFDHISNVKICKSDSTVSNVSNISNASFDEMYGSTESFMSESFNSSSAIETRLSFIECNRMAIDDDVYTDLMINTNFKPEYTRSKGSMGQIVRSLIDMYDRLIPINDYQQKLYPFIRKFITDFVLMYSNLVNKLNDSCQSYGDTQYISKLIYNKGYMYNVRNRIIPKHEKKPYGVSQLKETFKSIMDRAYIVRDIIGVNELNKSSNLVNNLTEFSDEIIHVIKKYIKEWDVVIENLRSNN